MVPLDKVCAKVGENRPSTLGDMARQSGLLSKKGLCHFFDNFRTNQNFFVPLHGVAPKMN